MRTKLGLLGLCAISLSVIAVSAGSAQATFSWLVLNAPKTVATEVVLTQGGGTNLLAALAGEKDSLHLSLLTELVGLKIAITCHEFSLVNANLEAHGKLSLFKIRLTGCDAYENNGTSLGSNLGCRVSSPGAPDGTIETNELKGELVLHTLAGGGSEVLWKLEPKGENFLTLRLEECALTEVNVLRGVVFHKDCLGQATTHAEKHLLEQGPLTALYFGAHSAKKLEVTKVDGSVWVKLAGAHAGLEWSGMDMP